MHAFDVSAENFQQEVLDKSQSVPVVVDFWAPWCGPCQTLKPILEKLAEEYNGRFLLAKVNADENQALSAQFGVRGIPSVKAVSKGQIINEFSGALPESAIREFLDKLLPSQSELKRLEALEYYENGDKETAETLLEEALSLDPGNNDIIISQAQFKLESDNLDAAQQLLEQLPINVRQDDNVTALLTKIAMNRKINELPDKAVLLQRLETNPNDLQTKLDIANACVATESYAEAIDYLFDVLTQDRTFQEDSARKTLLSLFTLLGNQDERVRSARKKLATLLN